MLTRIKKSLFTKQNPSNFFKSSDHPKIISDDILINFVSYISNNIDHVPNKNIGYPYADMGALRAIIFNSLPYFQNIYYASAYVSLFFRMAQCGEFSDIFYTQVPQLPYGTIVEKFTAWWPDNNHAYIKIKLPEGHVWPNGDRVRFCDAWYKKYTTSSSGVFNTIDMNLVLKEIGKGKEPVKITSMDYKVSKPLLMYSFSPTMV